MKQLIFLLLTAALIHAKEGTSGILSAGYGTIYNYEERGFSGYQLRLNPLIIHNNLSFELDFSMRNPAGNFSPFLWSGVGYRVSRWKKAPDLWLTGSWLYSGDLRAEGSITAGEYNAPGAGFMLGMKAHWLPKCFSSFAMSYCPTERCLYKSMQIGWEIHTIGFSVGGAGIRVPQGRLYSSFLFSLRYAFGSEWE